MVITPEIRNKDSTEVNNLRMNFLRLDLNISEVSCTVLFAKTVSVTKPPISKSKNKARRIRETVGSRKAVKYKLIGVTSRLNEEIAKPISMPSGTPAKNPIEAVMRFSVNKIFRRVANSKPYVLNSLN